MMNEENSNDVEVAAESYENSEIIFTERKPRSKERGPDKKPRTYKVNSMRNLDQFSQRPEEFAKYLKEVKGVGITGNSGIAKILLVFARLMFAGLGGWRLYNRYKNEKDNSTENQY